MTDERPQLLQRRWPRQRLGVPWPHRASTGGKDEQDDLVGTAGDHATCMPVSNRESWIRVVVMIMATLAYWVAAARTGAGVAA